MEQLTEKEQLVYNTIKDIINNIIKRNKTTLYQNEIHCVSWWISNKIDLSTKEVNLICNKLIKKGLINRNPKPINKSYGVSYILTTL